MPAKPIRLILAVPVILLIYCAGQLHAAETENDYVLPNNSPYKQKPALIEVLNTPIEAIPSDTIEPIDNFFWKARRFSYREEKNRDDWQLPEDTERKRAGDCEDKALWLYAQLRAAGYENLSLVVGRYRSWDASLHVWLTRMDENGNVFILDPTVQNKVWPRNAFHPGFYQPIFLLGGKFHCSFIEKAGCDP